MKLHREDIMNWLREDHTRTIIKASEYFDIPVQMVHDILAKKRG